MLVTYLFETYNAEMQRTWQSTGRNMNLHTEMGWIILAFTTANADT